MKNNNKIGVMLTVGDKSTMLFGVASIEEHTKIFICDHFDIVYYFQGLEYTFK
jgi:hypothetical protein